MDRAETAGPIVQLRRRLKAGADEIFDLWTRPELMARWMSPFPGAVDCAARCDLRPGGAFSLIMKSPDAAREVVGEYLTIERPSKLVFTWTGPLTNQVVTLVTVDIRSLGDETELVLTHERLPNSAIVDGHTRGWGNILDHLAQAIANAA